MYQPWRGIQTVRSRVTPAEVPGSGREAIKTLLASVSASWRTLSEANRQAWREYALNHLDPYWTGEDIRLPAFQRFCRMAFLAKWAYAMDITLPPTYTHQSTIGNLRIQESASTVKVQWTYTEAPGDIMPQLDIWACKQHSAGMHATIKDSLHVAFRDADEAFWSTGWPASGTYTIFGRPIWSDGTSNPWISARTTF